jgi:hypothetical protein
LHQHSGELLAGWHAHEALRASLDADQRAMEKAGWPIDAAARVEAEQRLAALLEHYAETAEPLPGLTRLEGETIVPIPSRGGRRASTRYRLLTKIDGYTVIDGQQWIVEFKLRNHLMPVRLIERSRQIRWYAWALTRAQGGHAPVGVLVDERLNEAPKAPRVVKAKRKGEGVDGYTVSHAMQPSAAQGWGRSTGALLLPENWSSPVSLVGRSLGKRSASSPPDELVFLCRESGRVHPRLRTRTW